MSKTIYSVAEAFLKKAKKPLLVITGPTASGKTAASIGLAKKVNGEIVNADSRQMFKELDIITNKITKEEMENVPHHLFSFLEPNEEFTVTQWKTAAEEKCSEILKSNKTPILVGGTGLYINAITKNFDVPKVPPNQEIRGKLEQFSNEELWEKLSMVDKKSAEKIPMQNRKYLIRALEIYEITKKPKSEIASVEKPNFESLIFGVAVNREELYERINKRTKELIEFGAIDEVKKLLEKGYKKSDPAMISHGVPEAIDYLENKITIEEFVNKMQQNTRNYAKRQLTWWRRDKRVFWFNPENFEIVESAEI